MSNFEAENDLIAQRLQKAQAIRDGGANPYANNVQVSHTSRQIFESYGEATAPDLAEQEIEVTVAGRVRFRRVMGKASFTKIQDWSTEEGIKPDGLKEDGERVPPTDDFLQLYIRKNDVGDEAYKLCKDLDLGDFIAVTGKLMRTRTGEISVHATELTLLTKSIRPLPDKWHGLSDVEQRFRQRYVDFAVNPQARRIMRIRSEVIRLIRQFFHDRDYLEVETPMLHSTPGGAAARPFVTHHNTLDLELFMRIAPELYLKRLLVGGLGRVFELGRVFRNEGLSRQHNPEFTLVEFYQAYATYEDLIELTEELISDIAKAIHGTTKLTYSGHEIEFARPWARMTVAEAVSKHAEIPEADLASREVLEGLAKKHGIDKTAAMSDGKLLMEIFDAVAEAQLIQPTFITAYPTDVSPLSRRNDDNPAVVDRFELFVAGSEMANAFSELNDPVDQFGRFEAQLAAKAAGDDEAHPMDMDYVRALEYGMPPAAGEGIGIDRLIMVMADAPNIREVIAFPQMRPERGSQAEGDE